MLAQLANLGLTIGGTLMGMNRAEDSANAAAAAAHQAAQTQVVGYRDAIDRREKALQESLGFLRPYEISGRGGQNLLNDALGINGPDAQRAFFSGFQNDPGFEAVQQAGVDTVNQSAASRGGIYSGGTLKALMDFGQRLQQSVFQDRLNRLGEVGKLGATTAGNMATVNENANKDLAGYDIAKAAAKAGGFVNASNAQQMGTQNYLQLLGYGMGQVKGGVNDLLGAFKMNPTGSTHTPGSFSSAFPMPIG